MWTKTEGPKRSLLFSPFWSGGHSKKDWNFQGNGRHHYRHLKQIWNEFPHKLKVLVPLCFLVGLNDYQRNTVRDITVQEIHMCGPMPNHGTPEDRKDGGKRQKARPFDMLVEDARCHSNDVVRPWDPDRRYWYFVVVQRHDLLLKGRGVKGRIPRSTLNLSRTAAGLTANGKKAAEKRAKLRLKISLVRFPLH